IEQWPKLPVVSRGDGPFAPALYPSWTAASVHNAGAARRSGLLETIADAVQCLDHLEIVVDHLELLAQTLDVAVDGAIVDIDLIVIGRIHQRVAAFDDAGAGGE